MRAVVVEAFPTYSVRHEGATLHPYNDIRGLVTTSVGVLIDPIELALRLDWRIGERAATQAEIRDDWQAIKALGAGNRTAKSQAPLSSIRLSQSGSAALVRRRLGANVAYIRKFLPNWDDAPADAQLGTASLCWAIGAGLNKTRPDFVAAFNAGDWLACKQHAHIRDDNNPGVIDRNLQQERCFSNAAVVAEHNLDPAVLNWPATVIPPVTVTV
jgi:GH24 family phage-related lysozyme (muramidase)